MTFIRKFAATALIVAVSLAAVDIYLWSCIFTPNNAVGGREYFLDVGSGASELFAMPNGAKVLIDAGPQGAAAPEVQKIFSAGDRYIDLAIITYRSADRFGGLIDLLDRYKIGAVAWNGREDGSASADWQKLMGKLAAKGVPITVIGAGDRIRLGPGAEIDILSPDEEFVSSADPDEASLVALVTAGKGKNILRTLVMGAAAASVEKYLNAKRIDLRADVTVAADNTIHVASATGTSVYQTSKIGPIVIKMNGS